MSVNYTPAARPLQDHAGNPVAGFGATAVNLTAASPINTLSVLSVDRGSVPFAAATTTYAVGVDNSTATAAVTAEAADAADERASLGLRVGAVPATNGESFPLEVGANIVTVTVTAEDGTTRDYTLTITRAADTDTPTVAIGGPTAIQTGPFTVTFAWSEPVTGFTASDVDLTDGTLDAFAQHSTNPLRWTATITPPASYEGAITVTVPAGAATDGTNPNPAASRAFTIDTAIPTVAIGPTVSATISFTVTLTWSEPVTGFTPGDVDIINGVKFSPLVNNPPGGLTWTMTVIPLAVHHTTVTVAVEAGAATDAAGNLSKAASVGVVIDTTPPTMTVTTSSAGTETGPFDVDFAFSEPVTGFTAQDVTVTNAALSGFSGGGADYSATITPADPGRVTVTVAAGVARDQAQHANTASAKLTHWRGTTPDAPQNLTVTAGDGRVTAQWQEPPSDTGNTADEYTVEWKESSQQWTEASSVTVPVHGRAHTASPLTDNTSHDMRVAVTVSGTAGQWAEATATPNPASGAPLNLQAKHRTLQHHTRNQHHRRRHAHTPRRGSPAQPQPLGAGHRPQRPRPQRTLRSPHHHHRLPLTRAQPRDANPPPSGRVDEPMPGRGRPADRACGLWRRS